MTERSTNSYELKFWALEIIRQLGYLVTKDDNRFAKVLKMINDLGPYVNSYGALPGQVFEVTTENPDDSTPPRIEVDDRTDDEGRIWFPIPGTDSYETTITRRPNGQPVFRGELYTYESDIQRFRVRSSRHGATICLTSALTVELVDENARVSMEIATNLGLAVPAPEEPRSPLADIIPVNHK